MSASDKRYRDTHKLQISAYNKLYYVQNRERLLSKFKINALKRRYGLSVEQYKNILVDQNGVCAVCGVDSELTVDHNHKNGVVRGIVCMNCNRMLAWVEFAISRGRLSKAVAYLRRTS